MRESLRETWSRCSAQCLGSLCRVTRSQLKHITFLSVAGAALLIGAGGGAAVVRAEADAAPSRATTTNLGRGIIAIGSHAWAGTFPAALSRTTDFAVFHAPEPGPDELARQAYEAGDPSSDSFVYQNFGFACEIESWTTCGFTASQARSRGFLARYGGRGVVLEGVRRAIDAAKPGYGRAVAQAFAARLGALSPRPDGVFMDDVNVVDSRLPQNGVPDGYTADSYRAALKAQFIAAVEELERAGYRTMANLGGVDTGELELSGIAEFTFLELCGTAHDAAAARGIAAAIDLARTRGRRSICHSFGPSRAVLRHAADVFTVSSGNDYRAPFPLPPAVP